MKNIKIDINNAKIISYEITLEDEYPQVSATIGLFSGDKKISTFSLRTQSYYSDSVKFEIPIGMIPAIRDIADRLEDILILECNKSFLQIEAPKK